MPRRPDRLDAGHRLGLVVEQLDDAGLEQRLPVVREVARPVALVGTAGMLHLPPLQPVPGLGEGRHDPPALLPGVPAAVVEVEMGEQDVGDVPQLVARPPDRLRQALGLRDPWRRSPGTARRACRRCRCRSAAGRSRARPAGSWCPCGCGSGRPAASPSPRGSAARRRTSRRRPDGIRRR